MRILYLTHRLPYAANRGDRIRAYHTLAFLAARATVDLVSLVHSDDEEGHADDLRGVASSVTTARVRGRLATSGRAAAAALTGGSLTHALLDSATVMAACRDRVARSPAPAPRPLPRARRRPSAAYPDAAHQANHQAAPSQTVFATSTPWDGSGQAAARSPRYSHPPRTPTRCASAAPTPPPSAASAPTAQAAPAPPR